MHPVLKVLGQWLDDAFKDVRVNSVGHVVVHLRGDPPFMVGVDEAGILGVIADLHVPFLSSVQECAELYEVVAMNEGLAPLGHVRVIPEAGPRGSCTLELRYQLSAASLTQDSLVQFCLQLSTLAKSARDKLRPVFGGVSIVSEG